MATPNASSAEASRPLLDWLLQQYPDTPRKRAKQWITAGRVSVDGRIIRQPQQVLPDPGAALRLLDRQASTLDCGPGGWQIHPRVNLLYLDAALAVVNKGPGLLAVPAEPGELSALSILADFLAGRLRALDRGVAGRSLPPAYRRLVPLPVHRLDQYTSGVFCLALNPAARERLIAQLKAHTMGREYVAYVQGRVHPAAGTWRNWLKLSDDELRQFIVPAATAQAEPREVTEAITHYAVIEEFTVGTGPGVVTKLRLRLETGRKHQIRVQAAHAGVPLLGDRTYHPRYRALAAPKPLLPRRGADAPHPPRLDFPRQALHAAVLRLEHPDRPGTQLAWTAALPKDMQQLEALLRRGGLSK